MQQTNHSGIGRRSSSRIRQYNECSGKLLPCSHSSSRSQDDDCIVRLISLPLRFSGNLLLLLIRELPFSLALEVRPAVQAMSIEVRSFVRLAGGPQGQDASANVLGGGILQILARHSDERHPAETTRLAEVRILNRIVDVVDAVRQEGWSNHGNGLGDVVPTDAWRCLHDEDKEALRKEGRKRRQKSSRKDKQEERREASHAYPKSNGVGSQRRWVSPSRTRSVVHGLPASTIPRGVTHAVLHNPNVQRLLLPGHAQPSMGSKRLRALRVIIHEVLHTPNIQRLLLPGHAQSSMGFQLLNARSAPLTGVHVHQSVLHAPHRVSGGPSGAPSTSVTCVLDTRE